eukprot:366270-Chlamydomonas_euryale.AAC.6
MATAESGTPKQLRVRADEDSSMQANRRLQRRGTEVREGGAGEGRATAEGEVRRGGGEATLPEHRAPSAD